MSRAWILGIGAVITMLALGTSAWLGYRAGTAAGERTQRIAADQLATDNATVLATVQRQAAQQARKLQQQLSIQQHRSDTLAADRIRISRHVATLQQEIRNAPLSTSPASPRNTAGLCPGDPLSSPDFIRLYNRAATTGTDTSQPARAATAAR